MPEDATDDQVASAESLSIDSQLILIAANFPQTLVMPSDFWFSTTPALALPLAIGPGLLLDPSNFSWVK